MKILSVTLTNFLSYPDAKMEFSQGVNVITGKNASGKTNLLESIHFSALGRSTRLSRDKDLINWDSKTGARVTVDIEKRFSSHEIDIYIDPQGKKRVLIDGLPIQRIGELMGVLNIIFFSPSELKLIKESPSDRRRFLDISLSQQSKVYFYTLQRYNKILVQRNKMLKSYKARPVLKDMLKILDADMLRCASYIIQERKNFVEKIMPYARDEHYKLTDGKEELRLLYETEAIDYADISGSLKRLQHQAFENDCRLEYTTIGPHRDDIKISASGVDIRRFGSQGQQRSAVLSLKLAEIALFKDKTGETPVLLLDDVLSELDAQRRESLFDAISGVQTMVTCTEFIENTKTDYKEIKIKDKKIHYKG